MADDIRAPEDEKEFSDWLDQMESEEDKAVAVAEREEERAKKAESAKKAERSESEVVTRSEYLADRFLESASEDEKRLFAIYRRGDEDPRQLQAVIDMAKTKAAEAAKALSAEVDEKAEKKAAEIAAEDYGAGPLKTQPIEKDENGDLLERIGKGDTNALVEALYPPGSYPGSLR